MTRPSPGRRRRPLPSSLTLGLALLALGTLWALAAPRASSADTGHTPDAKNGRTLFLNGCASCHGLNAQGTNEAPSLIGVGAAAVDFQVGTGRMPLAQPGAQAERRKPLYGQNDIDDLAAYVTSLGGGGPAVPKVDVGDGDLQLGGDLFRTNCAQCHNFAGRGGALTYGKHAPNLYAATPKQIGEAMRTGPESMPVFGPDQLNEHQVNSVARYVTYVRAAKDPGGHGLGHLGPIPEGLIGWLVGIGGLLGVTLWIGSRKV